MGMHVTEDLQHRLMYEQIALPLEDINLVIKEAVLLNVEMEESTLQKRSVMMKIPMIMTVAAHHVKLKMNIIELMVQQAQRIIEKNAEMAFM